MPHPDRGELPLDERIAEFWQRCTDAGRPHLPVTVYGSAVDAKLIDSYAAAGVTRCVFRIPAAPADVALPALDRAADVMRLVNA